MRHEDVPVLLVSGIAGSGKTSVLLQRIAYLFYQQRESLDPSQVFLITPNPVFQSYIDNVLPDLGERNPECLTWNEFLQQLMPPDRTGGQVNVALDRLERIDAACAGFAFDPHDFKEVHCNGDRLLSVGQILQVAAKFKNIPAGPHLVSLMRDELAHRLDTRLKQIATSDRILDELSALSPDEQVALFRETFDAQDEDEARVWAQQYVDDRYAAARKAVENDDWLRIDRIGMRLLGVENLVPVEWLYLKMALTGLGNPDAKYVMIDEVQDYTAAQLTVLARYFRRAHFLLLGDQNQAISPDTATFDDVKSVFQKARGSVEECRLMTSYRSSPAITALFAGLLADEERLRISSIRRQEEAPAIIVRHRRGARSEVGARHRGGVCGRGPYGGDPAAEAPGEAAAEEAGGRRASAHRRRCDAAYERRCPHVAQACEGPGIRPRDRARSKRAHVPGRSLVAPSTLHHRVARHGKDHAVGAGEADAAVEQGRDRLARRKAQARRSGSLPMTKQAPATIFAAAPRRTIPPSNSLSNAMQRRMRR